jgi:hypothetical protein
MTPSNSSDGEKFGLSRARDVSEIWLQPISAIADAHAVLSFA